MNDAESLTEGTGVLSTKELVVKEFNIIQTFILAGLDDFWKQLSSCLAQLLTTKLNEKVMKRQWKPRIRNAATKFQSTPHPRACLY